MVNPTSHSNIYFRVSAPEEIPQADEAKLIFTQGAPRIYKRADIEKFKHIDCFLKLLYDVDPEPITNITDAINHNATPQCAATSTLKNHPTTGESTTAESPLPLISSKSLKSDQPAPLAINPDTSDKANVSSQTSRNFARLNFDDKRFDLLVAVFLKKEPFFNAASKELYQDPYLFEHIRENFYFVNSVSDESTLDLYSHVQKSLNYMNLEEAKQILASFSKPIGAYSPEDNSDEMPVAVKIALKIYLRSKFFDKETDASAHFEQLKQSHMEHTATLKEYHELIARNKEQAVDESTKVYGKNLMMRMLGIAKLKTELENKTPQTILTLKQKLHLSQFVEDSFLAKTAQECRAAIEANRELIEATFKQNLGAEWMEKRRDLMEYIIGPKDFFFEKYGIMVTKLNSGHYNLHHQNVEPCDEYTYTLDNLGPKELEEEIRKDVSRYVDVAKIPMSVTQRIRTKPDSTEIRILDEILPILKNWMYAQDEEVKEVKRKLIAFNSLEHLCIFPSDITIAEPGSSIQTTGSIKIKLYKFGKTFAFTMNLRDLIIRTLDSSESPSELIRREHSDWIMSNPPVMPNNVPVMR